MHICFKDEPFILVSQAQQIYYVKDIKNPNWNIVVMATPRNFFDMPFIHGPIYTLNDDDGDMLNLSRDDIDGLSVDADVMFKIQDKVEEEENDHTDIEADDTPSDNDDVIGDIDDNMMDDDRD